MKLPTTVRDVARLLDHSLLHPNFTDEQIAAEVRSFHGRGLATFCVKPIAVKLTAGLVAGTETKVCTVIGFPHGTSTPHTKAFEAERAMDDGATELDMVAQVGAALGGNWSLVRDDIRAVVDVAHARGAIVKVIFENDFIPRDDVKVRLCEICTELGADFVKTSTGFGYVKLASGQMGYLGATEHDVALMRKHSGPNVRIKPAGGIRTLDGVLRFVQLGADRIGTGSAGTILKEAAERFGEHVDAAAISSQAGY